MPPIRPLPPTIATARLLLRPLTIDDAPAFLPLASLPEILRYTGETALGSLEEVRAMLRTRPLHDYAVHGYGRMACIEKRSGHLVGFCGLKYLDDLQETDIGYRFLPDSWGQGYASESAEALLLQGRAVFGLTRIVGLVQPGNGASRRVLEKLGMVYERRLDPDDGQDAMQLYATPA